MRLPYSIKNTSNNFFSHSLTVSFENIKQSEKIMPKNYLLTLHNYNCLTIQNFFSKIEYRYEVIYRYLKSMKIGK